MSVRDPESLEEAIRKGNSFNIYRNRAHHNLLSADEERSLGIRIRAGDIDARNTLIRHNLRLVMNEAMNFLWGGIPMDDLVQEGNLGLIAAAERFDPSRGARFSTYAMFWIRRYIWRELSKKSLVKIPENLLDILHTVVGAERTLYKKLRRDPTDQEIATTLGIPTAQVREVRGGFRTTSLDAEVGDGYALYETLEAEHTGPDPATARNHSQIVAKILENLAADPKIPEPKRTFMLAVIERMYGLSGRMPMTVQEIAVELQADVAGVKDAYHKAILLMRRQIQSIAPDGVP